MRRLLPFLAFIALVAAPHAAAAPGLLVGVDDDSLKWYGHTNSLLSIYNTLGLGAVRVTLDYPADPQERTELQRINQASRRIRVILAVTGSATSPPLDDASRSAYCNYVASLLRRLPLVHDVAIWTEPNSTKFWQPGTGAPAAYEALLAACYDAIHAVQPQANVIATSAPHARPGDWYTALGRAYRASGRTQPIFDTIGHNAYPQASDEPPTARHRHSIDEGDLDRLTAVLKKSFGVVPPIWYLEDGFQTSESSPLYDGRESDPSGDRRRAGGAADEGGRPRLLPGRRHGLLQLRAPRRLVARRLAVGVAAPRLERQARVRRVFAGDCRRPGRHDRLRSTCTVNP